MCGSPPAVPAPSRSTPAGPGRGHPAAAGRTGCPYKEGSQSGVIQVARDYGIPMIVTNVGGLSEQVENEITGLVTNVDADEIAAAMIRLANDKELYNQISRNEKEEAKKYTWENSAVYLIDIMGEKNEN